MSAQTLVGLRRHFLLFDSCHYLNDIGQIGGDFSFDHNNTTDGNYFDHFTRTRAVSFWQSPPVDFAYL